MYYIWNYERSMWWKPGHHGYSQRLQDAGRYTLRETTEILRVANRKRIEEVAFPVHTAVTELFVTK